MPRKRSLRTLGFLTVAALLAAVVIGLIAALLLPAPSGTRPGAGRAALIIDALYEWVPNDALIRNLTEILSSAGYNVKVIKGRAATVEAFRNVTLYDLLIIRCHGAYFKAGEVLGGRVLSDNAPIIFTGEEFTECLPLSCKYYLGRLSEEVVRGVFTLGRANVSVFALSPLFFERLEGRFRRGAVVIVASCYGLSGRLLADAFLSKGADVFISWDWKVSPQQMDKGLLLLVERAVAQGQGWVKAVETVDEELGADPLGGGRLKAVTGGG
ncbi:MAG: hypothetical protein ABWK01_01465 [Infirmifilum sp.]